MATTRKPPPGPPVAPDPGEGQKRAFSEDVDGEYQQGGVIWKPKDWPQKAHLFIGCDDLGEVDPPWDGDRVKMVGVEHIIVLTEDGWAHYEDQRVHHVALYRMLRQKKHHRGYVVRGVGKKGFSPPWVFEPDPEGSELEKWVDDWATENLERDALGVWQVVGEPTLEVEVEGSDGEDAF